MDKNYSCPYCSRKIKYFTRLIEHGSGEHTCKHCQKKSNIVQLNGIWPLFLICIIFALIIMVFYFAFGNAVDAAYRQDGSFAFLSVMFFGKGKEIKWIIWELIPFAAFFFISPIYIAYRPQKRFMEQTNSSIDLTVPNIPKNSTAKTDASTRTIPKGMNTVHTGSFEDISSSSGDNDSTRSFRVSDMMKESVDVSSRAGSTSMSYRDDAPLRKIPREKPAENRQEEEDVKTYIPQKNLGAETQKKPQGNFSGNRKF